MNDSDIMNYSDLLESEFLRLYNKYIPGAPANRIPIIIDSFWNEIYTNIFKPSNDEKLLNTCNSKILAYHVLDMESVLNKYIELCNRYGGIIKINSFCNLTGYTRQTFLHWNHLNNTNEYIFRLSKDDCIEDLNRNVIYIFHSRRLEKLINRFNDSNVKELNCIRYDVIKKLRESIQDENTSQLSTSTVGQVVRANNDIDVGKLYDVKNTLLKQDVSRDHIASPEERAKRLGIDLKG